VVRSSVLVEPPGVELDPLHSSRRKIFEASAVNRGSGMGVMVVLRSIEG